MELCGAEWGCTEQRREGRRNRRTRGLLSAMRQGRHVETALVRVNQTLEHTWQSLEKTNWDKDKELQAKPPPLRDSKLGDF